MRSRLLSILAVLALSGATFVLSGCLGGGSTTSLGVAPPATGAFATYEVGGGQEPASYVLVQFRGPADVVGPDFLPQTAWLFDTWTDNEPIDAPPETPPDETVVIGADGFQLYLGWPCAAADDGCVSVVSAREAGQPAMGIIGFAWFAPMTPGDTWRIPWRSPWLADNMSQPVMFLEVQRGTGPNGNQTTDVRAWDADAAGQRVSVDHYARYATDGGFPVSLQIGDPDDGQATVEWTRIAHGTHAPDNPPSPTPLTLPSPAAKVDWEDRLPPGFLTAGGGHGFSAELIWSTIQDDETAQAYLHEHPEARATEMDVAYGPPIDEAGGQSESTATVLVWDGVADQALEATVVQERASLLGFETRNRTYVQDIGAQDADAWHHRGPATRPVATYQDVFQRVCVLQDTCTETVNVWFSNGVFPDVASSEPHLRYRIGFTVPGEPGTFSLTASADAGVLVDAKVPLETAQAFLGPMPWA